ncbi:NADPH-dependent F420 reductase [Salsipaludibacter albus]|uniref:NADPH-dependent F420 reductase n=1 Tax=Salsipaludibacter albus TaxID=2849650 RepID=UPI001EE42D46|nr:NAD(P)-binding domain-containing protein [Salsipaludibacter albus]MBY5164108.1 NAD(P)-binding domain-containing protein [Salsipaludibacter albus]
MRIATLGAGNIGGNLGILWARAGHEVVFSSRHPEQLDDLVAEAGPNASAADPATAVADADVVLDALPFATSLGLDPDLVAGKVVVAAGNYYPGRDGEIDLDGTTQAGAIAARLPDSDVVKAFNMMAANVMRQHIDDGEGTGAVVFVAGDDPAAVAIAEQLVRDSLFTPVVTGDLATGAGFEPGTEVYGKRLTEDEARRHFGLEDTP